MSTLDVAHDHDTEATTSDEYKEQNLALHRRWQRAQRRLAATGRARHHRTAGRCRDDCSTACMAHADGDCPDDGDSCVYECPEHCPPAGTCKPSCRETQRVLDEMVRLNTPGAVHYARLHAAGEYRDDLQQVAYLVLLRYWPRWDPDRGVPFMSYVRTHIRHECTKWFGRMDAPEKTTRARAQQRKVLDERDRRARTGEPTDAASIAATLELSTPVVEEILDPVRTTSIDAQVNEDGAELNELVADPHAGDDERAMGELALFERAEEELASLVRKMADEQRWAEIFVMTARCGLHHGGEETANEVALRLGRGRGSVNRWLAEARKRGPVDEVAALYTM